MCRIASLLLLQRLQGSMSGDVRDFNNIETRAVIKFFFFLQGKAPKEIHAILTETLRENAPSYATVKNCVDQFKRCDFFTCVPGRLKTVTTSEIIDAEVIAAAKTWLDGQLSEFFFSGLRNLGQRAKKCTELRGEYVE